MVLVFIHTKPKGIEATCIINGDRKHSQGVRVPSASNIKLGGGQRMRLYILICVYAFPNIADDGQKLTKSMPRKR